MESTFLKSKSSSKDHSRYSYTKISWGIKAQENYFLAPYTEIILVIIPVVEYPESVGKMSTTPPRGWSA